MHLGLHGEALWIDTDRAGADGALAALRVSDRSLATVRDWFLRFDCQVPNIRVKIQFSDGAAVAMRDPRADTNVTIRVDLFDRSLYY